MKKSTRRLGSILCMVLAASSFFLSIPTTAFAEEAYLQVNDDAGVFLRKGPGTNYDTIALAQDGTLVKWVDTETYESEKGCSEGWYKVSLNDTIGYMCKTYLIKPNTVSFGRPWTTPGKAIIGGADFIAKSYIQRGQFTSYLKKFNVNPENDAYTHQYMANLQAPYSEGGSAYRSYKENGLLQMDLIFSIPVYLNMPESTSHPVNGAFTDGQSEVKDAEFEKLLEQENFPESYRVKLRLLHEQHKNWIFKAMHTNLDFTASVKEEKKVSSISACSACFEKPLYETEKNWFIANEQTVAYYLDPRNFIKEDRVLMFENLGYREEYNAVMVKTVLKGSFMEGVSALDNMSYPDLFVKAGKEANVSPIYLASLARIESGNKVNTTTSGERFEYNGVTYEGFYNFYNIGASSGESNPAKAGLVYASKGSVPNSDGVYVGKVDTSSPGNPVTKPVVDVTQVVNEIGLKVKNSYLANVTVGMTAADIKKKTSSRVTLKNSAGTDLADWEKIGTGTIVIFEDGTVKTLVVYGDLTGDGDIDSADLLRMRQQLLGIVTLKGAYEEAARTYNASGAIDSADLLRLRQHLLQKMTISQI